MKINRDTKLGNARVIESICAGVIEYACHNGCNAMNVALQLVYYRLGNYEQGLREKELLLP
ncbi:MAG: hypothetical protein CMJ78_16815 [Planctomycetaceae bacterium]|nr:hypothetical protein [Planctomycetaceae bacterium]